MIDTDRPLELRGKLSAEFRTQIQAGEPAAMPFWSEPRWLRAGAFFLAFIVVPGLLGGFGLASDLFTVGLMTGGFAAMILDGTLMDQKRRKATPKKLRLIEHRHRTIGPAGLTIADRHSSVSVPWTAVGRVEEFPDGICLKVRRRGLFPVASSELPEGTSIQDLRTAITYWQGNTVKTDVQ